MSRRGHHELEDEAEESGELNLTPYLDIVSTLVIFLVFTFQTIIEFRLVDIRAPAYGGAGGGGGSEEEPMIQLTLLIHSEGYTLVTDSDELGRVAIPKKGSDYDLTRLTQELDKVKRSVRVNEVLDLMAEPAIEYKHVVAAMDAAREYEGRQLFPNVVLASP